MYKDSRILTTGEECGAIRSWHRRMQGFQVQGNQGEENTYGLHVNRTTTDDEETFR